MKKILKLKTLFMGFICGIINGFLGSGGGIIAVQSLQKLGVESKDSHATSLFVILPLSAISSAIYIISGNTSWSSDILMLAIGAAVGGTIGAIFLNKIKRNWIDWIFTVLIFVSGIRMLF